jgi:hypothetical protein
MANAARGEAEIVVGGERRVMRLTLGALAELEAALGAGGLAALAERFEGGAFGARDLIALLGAGLRGGGAAGAARAAAALLAATFAPLDG